eukprot:scaffold31311_cov64-Phaeocystis_antarctica.AAC.13
MSCAVAPARRRSLQPSPVATPLRGRGCRGYSLRPAQAACTLPKPLARSLAAPAPSPYVSHAALCCASCRRRLRAGTCAQLCLELPHQRKHLV